MFYVYEHIRPDTGAIFYVGKGSGKRADTKRGRNIYWHRIVNKANGFNVRKIVENIDEELAFLVEQERIDQLRKLDIALSNMSNGGEGPSGYRFSDKQKAKLSEKRKGIPLGPMSDETKKKLSEVKQGRKFGARSQEWKQNISKGLTGRKRSEQECINISTGQKGKKLSEEQKLKLSIAFTGEKNNMWGKTHNEVAREKIRQSRFNCQKVECPHCKKVADTANAARWHFDRCKLKENYMSENTKKTQTIFIDNEEHDLDSMTDEQRTLVQHCLDLDRKINSTSFALQQLQVGKDAFVQMLKKSLETVEAVETVQ